MIGHNIRFKGIIGKIIPKLSFLPLLIWGTADLHICDNFERVDSCLMSSKYTYVLMISAS